MVYLKNKERIEQYFWQGIGRKKGKGKGICPEAKYLKGYIEGNLKYIKIIPCGKLWCSVCGQEYSILHRQRFARGLEKILWAEKIGYFVFTIPKEVREKVKDRKILNKIGKEICKFLVKYNWCGAWVRVWHFSGDGKGWKPHLNVLVELKGGYWRTKEDLKRVKDWYKDFLKKDLGYTKNEIVVNYEYVKVKGKKIHLWRYVSRPTLLNALNELNKEDLEKIKGMNTIQWSRGKREWGKIENKEIDDEGLKIFYDGGIEWKYGGSVIEIINEVLEYGKYIGYGIFEINEIMEFWLDFR